MLTRFRFACRHYTSRDEFLLQRDFLLTIAAKIAADKCTWYRPKVNNMTSRNYLLLTSPAYHLSRTVKEKKRCCSIAVPG